MQYNIGIDIGGTKVNMGIVDEDAHILATWRMRTDPRLSPRRMISRISECLKDNLSKNGFDLADIHSIGAGVPGTADMRSGIVEYCPNIDWINVPAGGYFHEFLGRDILISQDSRLAAWGEKLFGAARGYDNIACITLGTGIGCGLILDGKIFTGSMNSAGELGHTIIAPGGRDCPCGKKGCLERYCSGTGLLIGAQELFPDQIAANDTTKKIFDLAYAGNREMLCYIDSCVDILAQGLAMLVNIVSPNLIVISGGLCEHEDLIIRPLRQKILDNGYVGWTQQHKLEIVKAELGSDAPMVGASALYRNA